MKFASKAFPLNTAEDHVGGKPYKLSFVRQHATLTRATAAGRSITSDLLRVRAAGGIISAMPVVISSSRAALRKLPQAAARLPGLETPRNTYVHIQSLSRNRSKRRRHVRSRRARFRYVTRAASFKTRDKIIWHFPPPRRLVSYRYEIRRSYWNTSLIHCDTCIRNIYRQASISI